MARDTQRLTPLVKTPEAQRKAVRDLRISIEAAIASEDHTGASVDTGSPENNSPLAPTRQQLDRVAGFKLTDELRAGIARQRAAYDLANSLEDE